jgi:signal transduction histidine kinase
VSASEPTLTPADCEAARNLPRTLLIRQSFVGLSALLVIAIFAHKLIVLDWEITVGVIEAGAYAAGVASVLTLAVSYIHLRRHRRVLAAIASGGTDLEPEALARLAAVPNVLTWRFLALSSLCSFVLLIPGVRPVLLDDGRAAGLVILTITILAASALPHYVLARHAIVRVLEACPLEPLGTILGALELEQIPERRVTQKLLLAVVPPVALLGVGAVLVAHAHLRTLTEQSGRATAQMIAKAALEPSPAHPAARAAALAAAAQLGFDSRIEPQKVTEGQFAREPDGQLVVTEPVDDGRAVIHFAPDLSTGDMTMGGVIAFVAVVLAAVFASLFGFSLADDLVMATRSVRMLGTESVIRGATRIARPARFAVVAALGRAIEELTDRFRVFAKAQERALESRLAAQRMRGLLFASVSHDLKSPLNAILGFAELLATEELTAAQKESLGLIADRGRELLALIETILDAARVEAGQLQLLPKATEVAALVAEATRKGRELANQPDGPVVAEVAGGLPPLMLDATYGARAIAVVIAHALRSTDAQKTGRSVRVRAYDTAGPGIRLDIEYGRGGMTPEELDALLARQASSRARGITLGLSLARAVVELHGGRIEVQRAPEGTAVCQIYLPLKGPPSRPPRRIPSSMPPRRPV